MFLVVFVEIIELVFEEVEELLLSFEVKFLLKLKNIGLISVIDFEFCCGLGVSFLLCY